MSDTRPPEQDQPVYWFVLLERALEDGDLDTAVQARRELERLGVTVTMRRQLEVCHAG